MVRDMIQLNPNLSLELQSIIQRLRIKLNKNYENSSLQTRFAPSPTGYLHLGHVLHGVYLQIIAESLGAKIILRNEDHDVQRAKKKYFESIAEDLAWLGFSWGTQSDLNRWTHQSQRTKLYQSLINNNSGIIYKCFCTRKDLAERGLKRMNPQTALIYDGFCRDKQRNTSEEYSLRIKVPSIEVSFFDGIIGNIQQNYRDFGGDTILVDRKGNYSYQFCCAVDDALQGVNLIIRGEDLIGSTGIQLYLRSLFFPELNAPLFVHHPLLYEDDSKQKLSKRFLSESIAKMRQNGLTPGDVLKLAQSRG